MATLSLGEIQKAAQEEFGDLVITDVNGVDVTLRHALRLSREDRKALAALDAENAEDGEDEDDDGVMTRYKEVLRIAATNEEQAEALLDAIGDDPTLLVVTVKQYMEKTQLGEASGSES